MAAGSFIIDGRDEACLRYVKPKTVFNNLSGSVLLRLSDNVVDALRYFSLDTLELHMAADPLLTVLEIYRCA